MSYKNLSEQAREGLSKDRLSRDEMKNCMAKPIKPIAKVKVFFTWAFSNLDLIIFGMIALLGLIGTVGIYFDLLKL